MESRNIDLLKLGHRIRFLRNGKGWSLSLYSVAVALGVTLSELLEEGGTQTEGTRTKRKESDLPSGLREVQLELNLSEDDVEKLAQINFRGNRPRDKEAWRYLIETLKMLGKREPHN